MPDYSLVTLNDASGAMATVAPELGGWLLRYARPMGGAGLVDALHFSQAVVDRYPREMYAGNPILFPLVSFNHAPGKEHHYEWNGQFYPLTQHGFGRRLKWNVTAKSADSVTMELRDNPTTLPSYPFSFRQQLTYRLTQGRLVWEQTVENLSAEPMPFASGFHPYFAAPISPQGTRSDCFVELPDASRMLPRDGFESFSAQPFPAQNWSVQEDVSGTLFLGRLKKAEAILVNPSSELEVAVNFEEAPQYRFLALWAKTTQEPYYCIEPWTSLPNAFARKKDKELVILDPGKSSRASMWMELRKMA